MLIDLGPTRAAMVLELISETRAKVKSKGAETAATALNVTGTIVEVGEG